MIIIKFYNDYLDVKRVGDVESAKCKYKDKKIPKKIFDLLKANQEESIVVYFKYPIEERLNNNIMSQILKL